VTGRKLVLEEDGTEIDDDGALRCVLLNFSTLILLCDGEHWQPAAGIVWHTYIGPISYKTAQSNFENRPHRWKL